MAIVVKYHMPLSSLFLILFFFRYYQQAYSNLLDIRMVDTNVLEIKTIASFVNYKLCRLMFHQNLPKDAISQFKSHTERYFILIRFFRFFKKLSFPILFNFCVNLFRFKVRTGPKELIFEHHGWMSNQYSTFAELFDEAIRQGLPAVQTQHPGYYFQLAARHASHRQAACKEICSVRIIYYSIRI